MKSVKIGSKVRIVTKHGEYDHCHPVGAVGVVENIWINTESDSKFVTFTVRYKIFHKNCP